MNSRLGLMVVMGVVLFVLSTPASASWVSHWWDEIEDELEDGWDNVKDCCSIHGRVHFNDSYYAHSYYYERPHYLIPVYYTAPSPTVWYVHPTPEPAYIIYTGR